MRHTLAGSISASISVNSFMGATSLCGAFSIEHLFKYNNRIF